MDLYVYRKGTSEPFDLVENVASYTDSTVITADGVVYEPFADWVELSSVPDCSEALRADWRMTHIEPQEQLRADVDYLLMMQEG